MSMHLLILSIGPVQEFIAAARRTRDLWFGSYILSEVSKAAAKSLNETECTLIFPAPVSCDLLEPDSELSVPNRILAVTPEGGCPAKLAAAARDAAQNRWTGFAQAAREVAGESAIKVGIWDEQVEDVLEFYVAWVPWDAARADSGSGMLEAVRYSQARARLEAVLAGRKALRDFRPAKGRAGIHKSSLDGARESVLSDAVRNDAELRRRLRVKRQEHLDVVGLVKRCAPLPKTAADTEFVSVVRVAADPWIRRKLATPEGPRILGEIGRLCRQDFAPRVKSPAYRGFPYDATPLYLSRLAVLKEDGDLEPYRDLLTEIGLLVEQLGRNDQPSPYFAILAADGDKMGAALSQMESPKEHGAFSRTLSKFAEDAREIVEKRHGCVVYSGGDDVLAFIPVDQCLQTAKELHDTFGRTMNDVTSHVQGIGVPTLSVGIAIGHCYEPLEDLLEAARQAERHAKAGVRKDRSDERDGLAVHFWTRGSDAVRLRARWIDKPADRLERWVQLLSSDKLSDRSVYDLHELASDYGHWDEGTAGIADLLQREVRRVLEKKRAKGEPLEEDVIRSILERIKEPDDLERTACEMLIARHMSHVYGEAGES
jgi:CRISPR-associated protein Cmr2